MIFVTRNGKEEGPYSEEDTRKKIVSNRLAVNDLARREGCPEWTPLYDLLNLSDLLDSPPVPGKRPVLVWFITILYIPCATLLILFAAWILCGIYPFTEEMKRRYSGLRIGEMLSAGTLVPGVIISTLHWVAVVMLFRLKRTAFHLFVAAFAFEMAFDAYVAFAYGWRSIMGNSAIEITPALALWAMNIAVIIYSKRLIGRGVLR